MAWPQSARLAMADIVLTGRAALDVPSIVESCFEHLTVRPVPPHGPRRVVTRRQTGRKAPTGPCRQGIFLPGSVRQKMGSSSSS